MNDGVTFTETTRTLLESQKEKRGRKGQRLYLKKQYQISPKSDESCIIIFYRSGIADSEKEYGT